MIVVTVIAPQRSILVAAEGELLDILNFGTLSELRQLRGIGEVRARRLLDMRAEESTVFK